MPVVETILVISPHPDDLEIGMGGAVCKFISEGKRVVSVVVTDGRGSTNTLGVTEGELVGIRENETKKASEILGVKELIMMGIMNLKAQDRADYTREETKRIIELYSPVELYIPHPEIDKHPTHKKVSRLVLEALGDLQVKPRVLCYEVWTPFPSYDRIVDITQWIEKKTGAVATHRSQTAYRDYVGGVKGLNKYRAVFNEIRGVGEMEYAEVFIELG